MFVIVVTLINVIFWCILFIRLKEMFSSDGIIKKAQQEINGMLSHMNNAASRNIDLIEDRISRLKTVCSEAEKEIALLQNELAGIKKSKSFENTVYSADHISAATTASLSNVTHDESGITGQNKVVMPVEQYIHEQTRFDDQKDDSHVNQMDDSIEREDASGSSDILGQTTDGVQISQNAKQVSDSGAPVFYDAKESIIPKYDYKKRVMQLHKLGYTVEEIANDVGRSTQEVKFTIEIS